jgi:glycosyltransferase involved in cell wall biosynthesis
MNQNIFDRVYVINVDKRNDRRLRVLWHLDKIPFINSIKLYPAVNPDKIKRPTPPNLNRAEWSYYLTWYKIVEEAHRLRLNRILILDDDVWFANKDNLIKKMSDDSFINKFDILYLGASQHVQSIDWELAKKQGFYVPKSTDGSFAISLSIKGIEKVFKEFKDANSYGIVDSYILRRVCSKLPTKCGVVYPNLAIADVTDSDIRRNRDQYDIAAKFKWNLADYQWVPNHVLPKVSVIAPCYNAEDTIWLCLRSLVNQTYPNLEIIVIDDCSQDSSYEIIKDFVEKFKTSGIPADRNIEIIHESLPQNKGCYYARNRALDLCTGDYIAFQDSDDVSVHHRIEEQMRFLWEKKVMWTQCLILRTHLKQIDLNNPTETMKKIQTARIHIKNSGKLSRKTKSIYHHCCKAVLGMVTGIYRRELFDRFGKFLDLPCAADAEYNERIINGLTNDKVTDNVVSYLTENCYIENVYYKVNSIMYLCHQMNDTNLTNKFTREDRLEFQNSWRNKNSIT